MGLEGIVSKRLGSRYRSGRSPDVLGNIPDLCCVSNKRAPSEIASDRRLGVVVGRPVRPQPAGLVGFLSELHALKIDLFLRQQGLDTTTPAGKAMFQMMGVVAEFERAMIQERVRAGLARARSVGKRLGRPPIASALEKRIREALATPGRPGIRVIAERFGVNPSTVQRINRPFDGASVAVA
jgi:DNA invertase Pin-like site-specific DNA recombinase